MSRIGREPITIPAGVEVKLDGTIITVKGPKGTLTRDIGSDIKCDIQGNVIQFTRDSEQKEIRSKHGLYRALVNNMVKGVTEGFAKSLINKQQKPAKFSTRAYTRCSICGRPHAVLRKYGMCRICFREKAYKGEIPGVKKASW